MTWHWNGKRFLHVHFGIAFQWLVVRYLEQAKSIKGILLNLNWIKWCVDRATHDGIEPKQMIRQSSWMLRQRRPYYFRWPTESHSIERHLKFNRTQMVFYNFYERAYVLHIIASIFTDTPVAYSKYSQCNFIPRNLPTKSMANGEREKGTSIRFIAYTFSFV